MIFIGFARTYYLKGLYGTPPPFHPVLSLLVHIHGLVMTAWFMLFFMQVRLVAAHRTDLHRRLGVPGAILAGLAVTIATEVARRNVRGQLTRHPTSLDPLANLPLLLYLPLLFAVFVTAAILLRGHPDFHKRLMTLASLSILQPAIDRLPLTLPFLHFMYGLSLWEVWALNDLCVALCAAVDTFKNRRLHPAWIWGASLIVGMQIAAITVRYAPAWQRFAAWLVK